METTTVEFDGKRVTLKEFGELDPNEIAKAVFGREDVDKLRDGQQLPAIPGPHAFEEAGSDFIDAPVIEEIAELLIASCEELLHLEDVRLRYCWKREGGEAQGRPTYGKCVKASGLVRHYGQVEFVVWLAADHCREYGFDHRKLEALTFHLLLRARLDEKGKPYLLGPELELFTSELERYGLWHEGLVRGKEAFDQIPLDLPAF